MVCSICASLSRGHVDADLVCRISVREIAARHKVSIRSVRRHLKHLPEVLEGGTAPPSVVYIAPVTNNIFFSVNAEERALEEPGEVPEAVQTQTGNTTP